jgi:hypothetical protein
MSFDDGDAAGGRGVGSNGGGNSSGMNKSDPFFALIYGRDVSGWTALRMQRLSAAFVFAGLCLRVSQQQQRNIRTQAQQRTGSSFQPLVASKSALQVCASARARPSSAHAGFVLHCVVTEFWLILCAAGAVLDPCFDL